MSKTRKLTVPTYRYLTVTCRGDLIEKPEWQAKINGLGDSGWEAYAVSVQFNEHFFHFRRQKSTLKLS